MVKNKKYYSLEINGREADIYIFGDIVEPWEKEFWGLESDVSGLSLVNEVKGLDVDVINVHINSYGGIVSEGLAIYNTLKNHKAKVRTIVDGFACSAASVVFMAGEERLMNDASLLMIHNAWTRALGNASELRKIADDLEKITQGSIEAYKSRANISEEKIKELMDAETWILPNEALEWGFATGIIPAVQTNKAAASVRKALFSLLVKGRNSEKPQAIDIDELAARVATLIKQQSPELVTDDPPVEPPDDQDPPEDNLPAGPDPQTDHPQENKIKKIFNALIDGKEG